MKTKLFIIASLLLISSVNVWSSDDYIVVGLGNNTEGTPVDNLSKKSYYKNVFSKKERKDLKKTQKYISVAEKHKKIYEKKLSEIQRYEKMVASSQNAKTKKKLLRKINKLRKKAYKSAYKSIENYKKAIQRKRQIYNFAIDRIRLNDGSTGAAMGRQFEMKAKDAFAEADTLRNLAVNQQEADKLATIINADKRAIYATIMQSYAIANYKNDTSGNDMIKPVADDTPKTTKEEAKEVAKVTSEKEPKYDPAKDTNIYRLHDNVIIPKLNMSSEDLAAWNKAKQNQSRANRMMQQVDELYISIDSLHIAAEKPDNEFEREQIHNKATDKEMIAFGKLLSATKLYSSVNQKRYEIYNKYLQIVKQNKSNDKIQKASKYENVATKNFQQAKSNISISKRLMSQPEKYIQLMGANELMLSAIQLQEAAFSVYLDIPFNEFNNILAGSELSDNKLNNDVEGEKKDNVKSKASWVLEARNVYSKQKPKVVKYKPKKWTIFTVELGFFKGILPPSKFGVVQPIIFDQFKNNPVRRYMVGEYRTIAAVEAAHKKVLKLGYKKAYIVAIKNGYRQQFSKVKLQINTKTAQYKKWEAAELKTLKVNKTATKEKVQNEPIVGAGNVYFTETDNVKQTKGLLYFVQLGMFYHPVDVKKDFKGLEPILYEKVEGNGTRYILGTFGIYSAAKQEAAKLKYKGYKSAFVTAYHNGKHISLDAAKKLEQGRYAGMNRPYQPVSNKRVTSKASKITFAVQVGAFSRKKSASEIQKLKSKFSSRAINHKLMGGKHVYYIGNYDKYSTANYLKNRLVKEGHRGIFVIAFRNNAKIKITNAMRK